MAERSYKALNDQIQSLNTLNHDWAAWDDTYNYVQNPTENPKYIESNPSDTTFSSAELNYIFIIDNAGQMVFGKGYNLSTDQDMPIPESLNQIVFL